MHPTDSQLAVAIKIGTEMHILRLAAGITSSRLGPRGRLCCLLNHHFFPRDLPLCLTHLSYPAKSHLPVSPAMAVEYLSVTGYTSLSVSALAFLTQTDIDLEGTFVGCLASKVMPLRASCRSVLAACCSSGRSSSSSWSSSDTCSFFSAPSSPRSGASATFNIHRDGMKACS